MSEKTILYRSLSEKKPQRHLQHLSSSVLGWIDEDMRLGWRKLDVDDEF
jgi:hypothetical protein